MPTISIESLESIKALAGFDIEDIVQYWYLKRKSRCGVPLIRRLQVGEGMGFVVVKRQASCAF